MSKTVCLKKQLSSSELNPEFWALLKRLGQNQPERIFKKRIPSQINFPNRGMPPVIDNPLEFLRNETILNRKSPEIIFCAIFSRSYKALENFNLVLSTYFNKEVVDHISYQGNSPLLLTFVEEYDLGECPSSETKYIIGTIESAIIGAFINHNECKVKLTSSSLKNEESSKNHDPYAF
jgi:hypothetical protein